MQAVCRKTTNFELIKRLDEKIFDEFDSTEDEIDPATIWWLIECDGKIAGYAGLKMGVEGGIYGYLSKAGVLKEFRGKGLQKELITVRDKEAKKLGATMNITYVSSLNFGSANNLIACGYRLYSPEHKWGLKSALYFRKRL